MAAMDDIQENSVQSSLPDQKLLSIDEELWLMAEERAQEILCTIQPNVLSEVNRKDIIDYVQRLIGGYYGAEVRIFQFNFHISNFLSEDWVMYLMFSSFNQVAFLPSYLVGCFLMFAALNDVYVSDPF